MKVRIIPLCLALVLSAIVAYGLYSWCDNPDLGVLIPIFGGVSLFLTFGVVVGLAIDDARKSANIKTLSAVFAVVALVASIAFCNSSACSINLMVVVSCLIIVVWLLFVYFIATAKK